MTFFADLDERRLLYAAEGRKWGVLGEFRADLEAHGGSADSVEELCMDMSAAYIRGARESFPDAEITFDRFHVAKLLNQAVEKVRRTEQKERPELVAVAGTIRAHAPGILRWPHSRISNGMLEAMNSLVQAAKVRARAATAPPRTSSPWPTSSAASSPSTYPPETARSLGAFHLRRESRGTNSRFPPGGRTCVAEDQTLRINAEVFEELVA